MRMNVRVTDKAGMALPVAAGQRLRVGHPATRAVLPAAL